MIGAESSTESTENFQELCDRCTALLLVRVVAQACGISTGEGTTSICRKFLMKQEPWPEPITPSLINQVEQYVRVILGKYNDCPYHNSKHACHVLMSTNKLCELIAQSQLNGVHSYGLRKDSLANLALIFAALIHDVEHQGIPNRQLAYEDDELAVLYNDLSIAEQRSLYVGFAEFLKPDYKELRDALFPEKELYRKFRQHVVNLVLNTDIASPERTQLFKSKFHEAFPKEVDGKLVRTFSASSFGSDVEEEEDENEEAEPEGSMLQHLKEKCKSLDTALMTNIPKGPRRQRLGIRRSMDLSGEVLDSFSDHGQDPDAGGADGEDDLKLAVVMEIILTAADVAHNIQGWDQMALWSSRLYLELRKAYVNDRSAMDPSKQWFENQIGFLESYLLPLCKKLDHIGVFGIVGPKFAEITTKNRDTWLIQGIKVTDQAIKDGAAAFPS